MSSGTPPASSNGCSSADNGCRATDDVDVRAAYAEDASGLSIVPDAVYRPRDEREVVEILAEARGRGTPLTPAGLRSSTVGGPLAIRGAVLSLERLGTVTEIDPERRVAIAGPGVVLSEFKRQVEESGAYYPPDPTSEEECSLGGTVATNASGSRTVRWGATRRWIRALRVVTAAGEVMELRRGRHHKCTAGYLPFQAPMDLFVGSEGTLGVVTRVETELIAPPPPFIAAFAFFRDLASALAFVADVRSDTVLRPRCLELFDRTALDIIRPHAAGITLPDEARAMIFLEFDESDAGLERLWEAIGGAGDGTGGLPETTVLASDAAQKRALRRLRHWVPTTLNEWGAKNRPAGGRKVSTDFAVPPERLPEMIAFVDKVTAARGVDLVVRYGHVGDGHPHVYMRGRDAAEVKRLYDVAEILCREAVRLGGTVAAEHGIGKVKRRFLPLQYPAPVLAAMRAVKSALDPDGLLAPGNIF